MVITVFKKSYKQKLLELFYITDMKRVKAEETGNMVEADELWQTQDYLDIVIGDELNVEWNQ